MNQGQSKLCPTCAAQFVCQNSGEQACWCASLPKIMPLPNLAQADAATGCYCPDCLKRIIQEKVLPTSN